MFISTAVAAVDRRQLRRTAVDAYIALQKSRGRVVVPFGHIEKVYRKKIAAVLVGIFDCYRRVVYGNDFEIENAYRRLIDVLSERLEF